MLPTFPKSALQVLRIIRKEVEKPKKLPKYLRDDLRWRHESGRHICPMGLHEDSESWCPTEDWEFAGGRCNEESIKFFADWWDDIIGSDAQAAVDFIWKKG